MENINSKVASLPAAPNRRAVLAFIALTDLPVPIEVNFHDGKSIFVKVETTAEADGWAALLGMDTPTLISGNPGHRDIYSTSSSNLNGWFVYITAYIPAGQRNELDVETGIQLQQLVDESTGGAQ